MTERDDIRTDETTAEGSTVVERYDGGVREDDDGPIDPHEEVEGRLKDIEEEQRAERDDDVPTSRSVEDRDEEDHDDTPADSRAGQPADAEGDMADAAGAAPSSPADGDDEDGEGGEDPRFESDEDRQAREDAFAAEHDPEQHDLSAGEEFRQAGDWTAEDGKLTADDVVSGDGEGGVDGRRLSSVDEIRDGGYGVGSAAPIDDGAMPLDHSVKAWEDTKTYLVQGEHGYDGVDPDVWFLDDRSAERAGFDHAGG